ncbi:hypothetical protein [Cupriavidus sp. DF5525]|uniref:hypothetical protein n=1 Tax=Cupriavidus sp. DF5525 TaxID=3160989 RepID=UPI0032DFB771
MRRYLWNILIALDQFGNALAAGSPDETISSRAGKAQAAGRRWGCILCRMLDWFERDHCARSIEADEGEDAALAD